ncbi:MAG: hypothetical protein PHO61_01795 [Candidatus ainarchaeum sp.]|nr:hypothetical protein [Candidatus ainarchaeum sp.]
MNQITKILTLILILLTLISFVNSSLLVNTTTDKKILGENEIAILTIKLLNDSETELTGVQLRLQADEGIKFAEGEDKEFTYKQIEKMKGREAIELKIKIKCTTSKEQRMNIYTYYGVGEEQENASVVYVESKPLPIELITSTEKKEDNGQNKIIVNYKLINHYGKSLYKVGAEILVPTPFEVITEPVFMETLADEGIIEENFNVLVPIETDGEYQVILAYGYIDSNTPHYFEKISNVKYAKTNYGLIGLIGLIVLIIAVYLFLKKDSKVDIKGSA